MVIKDSLAWVNWQGTGDSKPPRRDGGRGRGYTRVRSTWLLLLGIVTTV